MRKDRASVRGLARGQLFLAISAASFLSGGSALAQDKQAKEPLAVVELGEPESGS